MLNTRTRPSLECLDARVVPAVFFVDDDKTQRPDAQFTSIQAAVDAAAATKGGDTIQVYPGTYTEQVLIQGTKLNGLELRSVEPLGAVIQAPGTLAGAPAVVRVTGAKDVTVDGFTISGPAAGLQFGVLVDGLTAAGDTSATVRNNLITDIRPGEELSGDQTGFGVYVTEGAAARVTQNVVQQYQKGGVVVIGAGTTAEVSRNEVLGSGPTAVITQNGIQVSDGAAASVTGNFVSGNVYTGDQTFDAAGVVVLLGARVDVKDNVLQENDVGVLAQQQSARLRVEGNRVEASVVDGIQLLAVNGAELRGNQVNGSGRDGIRLDGLNGRGGTTNTLITGNVVTNNGEDGLHVSRLSSRNEITRNEFLGNGTVLPDGTVSGFDIFDESVGDRTAGTRNTYGRNDFDTTNLTGLRRPGGGRGGNQG